MEKQNFIYIYRSGVCKVETKETEDALRKLKKKKKITDKPKKEKKKNRFLKLNAKQLLLIYLNRFLFEKILFSCTENFLFLHGSRHGNVPSHTCSKVSTCCRQ